MLLVSIALASSNYPGDLAAEVGSACDPVCTVCHATAGGGAGTVDQPFGVAMMERGLLGGGQTSLLTAALATLADDGVDSDGDGTSDVDELAAGTDPNPDGETYCDVVTPQYGCLSTAGAPVVLGLFAGLAALRRRAHPGP